MADLHVDKTEIGVIIIGLTAIEDAWLTEEGRAACVRLAHKLGALAGDLMFAEARGGGDA